MNQFSGSALVASRLVVRESAESTNAELVKLATDDPSDWSDFGVLVTLDQRAGRGRLNRTWISVPGKSLAASVLLRVGRLAAQHQDVYGWLSLLAGVSMCRALSTLVRDARITLKWPNDVLVDGRKVCGILGELTPEGDVVIGAGVNLSQTRDDFEAAGLDASIVTSLALSGAVDVPADEVLLRYIAAFRTEYEALIAADGDAMASGLHARALAVCSTIGRQITVSGINGASTAGTATGIDRHGRLEMITEAGTQVFTVGDVTHVRTRA